MMTDSETYFFDDVNEGSAPWHWTKPLEHPRTAQANKAAGYDRPFLAAVLAILLACVHFTATDHGVHPQTLSTSSQLSSKHVVGSSTSSYGQQYQLVVHSIISKVNLKAGQIELQLAVQHPSNAQSFCSGGAGAQHHLVIGSTSHGAAQVVVPLCQAPGQPVTAVLPLIKQSAPHPFDEHTVAVRLRLQPSDESSTQHPPSSPGLSVEWSAVWAVPDLQVFVERNMGVQARLLAAAAGAPVDGGGGWGSALLEQVAPSIAGGQQQEVVYSVKLVHSSWLRIIHLAAALLQVVAVVWLSLLLLGQCVCAYLMQRMLCNTRVH